MMKMLKMGLLFFLLQGCIGEELTDEQKTMRTLDDDTLLGPDKNKNGVRDDVEYWINENITEKDLKYAVMMYAKYKREAIRHANDREKSNEMTHLHGDYDDCFSRLVSFEEGRLLRKTLGSIINNSKKRMKAFAKTQHNFAGEARVTPWTAKDSCPFKLSKEYK